MKLLFLSMMILILNSCDEKGGETGNPIVNSHAGADVDNSVSFSISSSLCNKLKTCYPDIDIENCLISIDHSNTMDIALGLPDETYYDFLDIIRAERDQLITPNKDFGIQCRKEIQELTCESTPVTTSYNESSPTNFSLIHLMVPIGPGSCNFIFRNDIDN